MNDDKHLDRAAHEKWRDSDDTFFDEEDPPSSSPAGTAEEAVRAVLAQLTDGAGKPGVDLESIARRTILTAWKLGIFHETVKKTELAKLLKCTPGRVSQLLSD